MSGNGEHDQSADSIRAAMAARSVIRQWSAGAELIEVVRSAYQAGWLTRLRATTTASELAASTGAPAEQVSSVLAVLVSAGVVSAEGARFQLVPAFDALVAGASGVELAAVLGAADLARHEAGQAAQPAESPQSLTGEQALTLARDWGVRPSAGARQLFELVYQVLPEYRARLEAGGPLLDVGSGVGGALLTTLTLFDGLRAVGVEVVPEVAAEARLRAQQAGVAGRVEIRQADARGLDDEGVFAVCYWAQAFFPSYARDATLAAIVRALRPDGLLLLQELVPAPAGEGEPGPRVRLDQLFYRRHGVDFEASAESLAAEATAAGFGDVQIVASPLGRRILTRKRRA
jgi:SAM-dependent methyltransferase